MRYIRLLGVSILCISFIYSQNNNNYNNGDGSILQAVTRDSNVIQLIKHTQVLEIGNLASDSERVIYDDYYNGKKIGILKNNDTISISEIALLSYGENTNQICWFHINHNELNGWIKSDGNDPYKNNHWSVINQLEINNKKWTIRKINTQTLAVFEVINVRDLPGVNNTNILFKLTPSTKKSSQVNIDVVAITEEMEVIEGLRDSWIEIIYNGKKGWIFGGYAKAMRGGTKYLTPYDLVQDAFGWL